MLHLSYIGNRRPLLHTLLSFSCHLSFLWSRPFSRCHCLIAPEIPKLTVIYGLSACLCHNDLRWIKFKVLGRWHAIVLGFNVISLLLDLGCFFVLGRSDDFGLLASFLSNFNTLNIASLLACICSIMTSCKIIITFIWWCFFSMMITHFASGWCSDHDQLFILQFPYFLQFRFVIYITVNIFLHRS